MSWLRGRSWDSHSRRKNNRFAAPPVDALSGTAGRIIEETNSGREFGIARAVENVICRKTRRNQRVAYDFIPVVAQATFHEKAIGDQPAVLRVSAYLRVVFFEIGSTGKNGIASTRRGCNG